MTQARDRPNEWPTGRWDHQQAEPEPPRRSRLDRKRADRPVNPYAIVALAAAGLFMFPLAILFGLAAFGRRGGRLMTVLALLLALAEVGLVTAAIVLAGPKFSGFTFSVSRSGVTAGVSTSAAAPPSSTSTAARPPTAALTPAAAAPAPASADPGAPCQKSQALLVVSADAGQLVCYSPGRNGDYVWSAPQPLAAGVHNRGEPCDPALTMGYVGRTADAHALACKGAGRNTTWQDWP